MAVVARTQESFNGPNTSFARRIKEYAKDEQVTRQFDRLSLVFGEDTAFEIMKQAGFQNLYNTHIINNTEVQRALADADDAIEEDPLGGVDVTMFSDAQDKAAEFMPDEQRLIDGTYAKLLDFAGTVVSGMFDPSTFDPVEFAAVTAAGATIGGAVTGGPGAVPGAAVGAAGQTLKRGLVAGARKLAKETAEVRKELGDVPEEAFARQIREARDRTAARLDETKADINTAKERLRALDSKIPNDAPEITQLKKDLSRLNRNRRRLELSLRPDLADGQLHQMEVRLAKMDPESSEFKKLAKRRDKLSKRVNDARNSLKPVLDREFKQLLDENRSIIESARMSQRARDEMARGLLKGREEILAQVDEYEGALDRLRKAARDQGVNVDDQTKEMSAKIEMLRQVAARTGDKKVDIGTIMAQDLDELQNVIETTANNIYLNGVVKRVDSVMKVYQKTPTIEAERAFAKELNQAMKIGARIRRQEVHQGQLMQVSSSPAEGGVRTELTDTFLEVMEKMNKGGGIATFARQWRSLRTDRAREEYMASLTRQKGKLWGSLEDMYLNALISSVATPVWNLVSMTGLFGLRVAERRLMEGYRDSGVAPGESGILAKSFVNAYYKLYMGDAEMKKSLSKELERARGVFNPDIDDATAAKLGIPTNRGSIFRAAGRYGRAGDVLAYMNGPRYLVAAGDAYMRFAIRDAFTETMAHRSAYFKVVDELRRGAKLTDDQIKNIYLKQVDELKGDPNATVIWRGNEVKISEIADKEASVISMMDELQNPRFAKVDDMFRSYAAGRMLIPFFRVMAITARETANRLPAGMQKILPSVRADLEAGGERAAEARAKMATGNMLAAMATGLWAAGVITDDGPVDPSLNATWRNANPQAVLRTPAGNIGLQRFGIVGEVLQFTGNMARLLDGLVWASGWMPNDPETGWTELIKQTATELTGLYASVIGDDILFNDLDRIIRAVGAGNWEALQDVVEQRAGAAVPFSALNSDIREYLKGARESADGIWATVVRKLPMGHVEGLSVARNSWGHPTANFENMVGSLTFLGFTPDPHPRPELVRRVTRELEKHLIPIAGPTKMIQREGVSTQLSMEEHNALKGAFGHVKLGGMTLDQALDAHITALKEGGAWDKMSSGPRGGKRDYLDSIVEEYREAAREWLLGAEVPAEAGLPKESPYAMAIWERILRNVEFTHAADQAAGIPGLLQRLEADTKSLPFRIGVTQ